jgi:hypothetical protein
MARSFGLVRKEATYHQALRASCVVVEAQQRPFGEAHILTQGVGAHGQVPMPNDRNRATPVTTLRWLGKLENVSVAIAYHSLGGEVKALNSLRNPALLFHALTDWTTGSETGQ